MTCAELKAWHNAIKAKSTRKNRKVPSAKDSHPVQDRFLRSADEEALTKKAEAINNDANAVEVNSTPSKTP